MRMTATQATVHIARLTGRKPHVGSVIRWIKRGVRGRRLPAIRQGWQWLLAPEDIERFIEFVNTRDDEANPAIEAARLELETRRLDMMLGRHAARGGDGAAAGGRLGRRPVAAAAAGARERAER